MGFRAHCIEFIEEVRPFLPENAICYVIGAQDCGFNYSYLIKRFPDKKSELKSAIPSDKSISDTADFKTIFKIIFSFDNVITVDINDRADVCLDLTKEIPEEHCNKADFVCEMGTLEHMFDVKTAIENINKILKKGGIILHADVVSFYQHGYYNFNPNFFSSLYKGSGYKEIFKAMQVSIYNPFFIIDRRNLPKYVRYLFYITNKIISRIAVFRFNLPLSRNGENLSYKIFNFYLAHFSMTKNLLYVCAYIKNSNSLKIPYDVWD